MFLRFRLILLLCVTAALHAADPKPAYLNPNYTGPAAPGEILPGLDLPAGKPFAHPGILLSQSDLDFVRARLAAKEEPWTGALARMRTSEFARLDYKPRIIPVIDPHAASVGYLMKDATAAYAHAVLWCVTGERAHAEKAIEILDYNAATLVEIQIGRSDQGKVTAGFTAGKYAGAAELIAHYRQPDGTTAGWPKASADRFGKMLVTVFYPRLAGFKPDFNGNWDAIMIASMMSIAVFTEDHAMFNTALDYYLHGKGNGAITHYIHPHGQNQESGRDQIHGQMGLGALAAAAEMANKQGIDLYSVANNRLAIGFEHMAKYLSGHDVEITGDVPISPKGRDGFRPVFELVYQHYVIEKGMNLPYVSEVLAKNRPEGVDLIIHQAWGTLLHYRGPALTQP
jgi:hypothetical protein